MGLWRSVRRRSCLGQLVGSAEDVGGEHLALGHVQAEQGDQAVLGVEPANERLGSPDEDREER